MTVRRCPSLELTNEERSHKSIVRASNVVANPLFVKSIHPFYHSCGLDAERGVGDGSCDQLLVSI